MANFDAERRHAQEFIDAIDANAALRAGARCAEDVERLIASLEKAQALTNEQVERMVKDANFVGPGQVYSSVIFNDLCCHVRALAEERSALVYDLDMLRREHSALQKKSAARLRALERIESYLVTMFPTHDNGCDCARCETVLAAREEATRLIEEAAKL